jgi:hypothetical protein
MNFHGDAPIETALKAISGPLLRVDTGQKRRTAKA